MILNFSLTSTLGTDEIQHVWYRDNLMTTIASCRYVCTTFGSWDALGGACVPALHHTFGMGLRWLYSCVPPT